MVASQYWRLSGVWIEKNLRAVKRLLSTNTKTKLDLTKAYWGFSQTHQLQLQR